MSAPTVTFTTEPPVAHITFRADDLDASVRTVTLYRIAGGVTTTVRTAVDAFAVGGIIIDDAEAPFGVPVTYRAQQFDAAGAELGLTPGSTVTIPMVDGNVGWLSDPLDPTSGVRVILSEAAGTKPSRKIDGQLYRVGMRTIALVGQQGLLTGQNMDFYTETSAAYDAVLELLGDTGGLVLIRTPPPMRVPRLLYCWASNAIPSDFDIRGGDEGAAWSNVVDEVSPPTGAPIASLLTWQLYVDAFPTWADFNAAYLTWFDAMSNPPEA